MPDSIAETIRSHDMGQSLDDLGPLLRFADGIEKARHVISLLQGGYQLGKELDDALKQKRDELAATTEKAVADAKLAGQQQRDQIIAEARAEAKRIIDDANAQAATVNGATDAKNQELAKLEGHIAEMKAKIQTALA